MKPAQQPDPWIAVVDRLPPEHVYVAVLIDDPSVAIFGHPTVARRQREFSGTPSQRDDWWAGVPGQWMPIRAGGDWVVTHWAPLPPFDDGHWSKRSMTVRG